VKERVATVLIAAAALVAIVMVRSRQAVNDPAATVYRAFDAARSGDADAYLACFAGDLRRRFEGAMRDAGGRDAFGEALKRRCAELTGVAVSREPAPDDDTAREIVYRVESVYRDRNEVQLFRLRRTFRGWRIVEISGAESSVMPIPYGTPVRQLEAGDSQAKRTGGGAESSPSSPTDNAADR